jgi:hypothetical protein
MPPFPVYTGERETYKVNDQTRRFFLRMGDEAERLYKAATEAQPPITTKEWRTLLGKLSRSCRATADLLAEHRRFNDLAAGESTEVERKTRGASIQTTLGPVLTAVGILRDADRDFAGMDTGLGLLADYFDHIRKTPLGRKPDSALRGLIKGRLAAYIAAHGDRNVVHWNISRQRYQGAFLSDMKSTLARLGQTRLSDNALAQQIEAVKKTVKFVVTGTPEAGPHDIGEKTLTKRIGKPRRTS